MQTHKTFRLLCFYLLFVFISSASAFATEKIEVHLEEVSLTDFIKFIASSTNQNISYTPNVIPRRANVTIYSPITLSKGDLLKIFHSVLNAHGLITVKKGKTLVIIRKRELRDIGSQYVPEIKKAPETILTTIVQLNNLDVRRLKPVLTHFISSFGKVDLISGLNAAVITDTKEKISYIERLLRDLDRRPEFVVKLIPIKGVSANKIATELNRFFMNLAKESSLFYKPIILSETTGNSILVAAKEKDFVQIENIINKILAQKQNTQRVFYLKNAIAKDSYSVITKLLAKTPAFKQTAISYDEATNSIIVFGPPTVFDQIETLIKKLDVPRKQVYIEALIIETSLSKLLEFGVEWSTAGKTGDFIGQATSTNTGNLTNIQNSILNNNQMTPLPGGFSVGILGDIITYQGIKFPTISALLNVLKTQQGINILSHPHIVTLDNQKANIFVGENRPYIISQKYDVNGNPIFSYDYRDVGVKLNILPHISKDKIIMEISLEVKKIMETITAGATVAPITLTRSTTTKIALKDAQKILISGLIKDDKSYSENRVPILSSIPLLGRLFRYKKVTSDKTNLLIFLTAKIVTNQKEIEEFQKLQKKNQRKKRNAKG